MWFLVNRAKYKAVALSPLLKALQACYTNIVITRGATAFVLIVQLRVFFLCVEFKHYKGNAFFFINNTKIDNISN